jgi:hypothetical protein
MSRLTRPLTALVLFLALCDPVVAQSPHGRSHPSSRVIADPASWLWERISTSLAHLLKGGGGCDPNGMILCKPVPVALLTDGGGGCDPDGSPRCAP